MFSRPAILLLACCAAAWSATISLQPSASTVSPGQVFSLNIAVSGVADLFAYQFDLGYDQARLQAIGIVEGPFLGLGGSTFFIPGGIDNAAGLISATANSRVGAVAGVTGGGVLATVSFKAIGAGTSPVNLLNPVLLDSALSGIAPAVQNAAVSIGATNVPEPGALPLFGVALALRAGFGILALRRRRATG